jgi:hypothetical protein
MTELAAALKWNNSLRSLDLSLTRIAADGIEALSRTISENYRLHALSLLPSALPLSHPQLKSYISRIESTTSRNKDITAGLHPYCLPAEAHSTTDSRAKLFTSTHLIVLRSSNMSDSLLDNCVNLEYLDLSNLGLEFVPLFVPQLKNLVTLDLRSSTSACFINISP